MSIPDFMFYLFSFVMLVSALRVITAANPVHAVLFLILAFFNAAGLFLLIGAEFLAMLLIVVYVGAVMVLFLFVVMMLDVSFATLKGGVSKYTTIGLIVGAILFVEVGFAAFAWNHSNWPMNPFLTTHFSDVPIPPPSEVSNTLALGQVVYTDYIYLFQGAGLVLLVAMIGAIVLTLRRRPGVKKQVINDQLARSSKDEITLHKGL